MGNFKALLELLEEKDSQLRITVRKFALVSLVEVFKDLLPAYTIRHNDDPNVRCKSHVPRLSTWWGSNLFAPLISFISRIIFQSLKKIYRKSWSKQSGITSINTNFILVFITSYFLGGTLPFFFFQWKRTLNSFTSMKTASWRHTRCSFKRLRRWLQYFARKRVICVSSKR